MAVQAGDDQVLEQDNGLRPGAGQADGQLGVCKIH